MANRTIRTIETREKFLLGIMRRGIVSDGLESADLTRSLAYVWRKEDPDFAADWDAALEIGLSSLEDEGMRRAHTTSDTLLMFMLKTRKRDVYGDRMTQQLVGKNDESPIEIVRRVIVDPKGAEGD